MPFYPSTELSSPVFKLHLNSNSILLLHFQTSTIGHHRTSEKDQNRRKSIINVTFVTV